MDGINLETFRATIRKVLATKSVSNVNRSVATTEMIYLTSQFTTFGFFLLKMLIKLTVNTSQISNTSLIKFTFFYEQKNVLMM